MHVLVRIFSLFVAVAAAKTTAALLMPEVIREGGGGLDVVLISTLVFVAIAVPGMLWAKRIKTRKAAGTAPALPGQQ